jgi:hypothetical protein
MLCDLCLCQKGPCGPVDAQSNFVTLW